MRSLYRYNQHGELIFAMERGVVVLDNEPKNECGFYIMPDIQPYKSMADGSMITSRSHQKVTPHRLLVSQDNILILAQDS